MTDVETLAAAEAESSHKSVVEDGKNIHNIYCERCSSLILLPQKAMLHTDTEFFLPYMKKKSEVPSPGDGETISEFWLIDDMFQFENVGFSNTVDGVKYLICADCEIGPIGWHKLDKKAFYIALSRVKNKP
ncbi:hypothetical protein CHS0354_018915 [Potamilus streckersoni]|uniref:Guanine nucleotide exchange factor MSS4 n=1 Tax=Potamilus streckersoni TaxID=2493646 RepID=A0AAE0RMV7_9BIVA|nr:hypothetical protein CHS0354_018915 [Potamilus streckersoni]